MHEATQRGGTPHTGHVLEAYLVGTESHQFVHNAHVVLNSVDGRVGDAQGSLADHAGLLGGRNAQLEVARVVQSAERAHDVHTLRLLHPGHQATHVGRHAVHTQAVQRALQHVGLDASLVERLGPGTDGFVGILAVHEVHLLEGAAVGLDAVEAAHRDNHGCNLLQLVHTRLVFTAALPHVAVHQTEFYFFCHSANRLIEKTLPQFNNNWG